MNIRNTTVRISGRRCLVALICGCLCTALVSCMTPLTTSPTAAAPGNPGFQVATIQDRIFPDTTIAVENPLLVDPVDRRIKLYGAGRETVYIQLIIPPGAPAALTLHFDPLKKTGHEAAAKSISIDSSQWRLFHILSVPAGPADAVRARLENPENLRRTSVPDALVEIAVDNTGAFALPKGSNDNLLLLAQLAVPSKLADGDYAGQILLKSPSRTVTRPMTLRSWGFDLPEPQIDVVGALDIANVWAEHGLGALRVRDRLILPPDAARIKPLCAAVAPYARLLDESGVEPWITNVFPRMTARNADNVTTDWDGYRLLVDAVVKTSSRGRKFWLAPVDLSYPSPQTFGPYTSPQYQRVLRQYLGQFNARVLKSGLSGKGVAALAWVDDYRQGLDLYGSYVAMAREIFRSEQPVTVVNPFISADLRPLGWASFRPMNKIREYTRLSCPGEKWLDPYAAKKRDREMRIWWRPMPEEGTIPLAKADYPRFFPQALAWTAWRYGTQGVVLERTNDWPQSPTSDDAKLADTQRTLVYPGKWFGQDRAAGSLRLKMIHCGLQDVAYLRALERAGKKERAEWLARHLVRFAHTDAYDGSLWSARNDGLCASEQAWTLARLIAGYELSRPTTASTQPADIEQRVVTQKLLNNRFREETQGMVLETDGVRAKNVLDVHSGEEKVEWTFHPVVRNFTENESGGTVQFVDPGSKLRVVGESADVSNLSWGWPIRTELKLESPAVALGVFGVNAQPIALKLMDGTETLANARYCALAAQKLERTIVVDGDFGDWPESPAATAGNFVRIRPDGLNDRPWEKINPAPAFATTVKIGYTPHQVCFAFTCYQPKDRLIAKPSNSVASSLGLPWGEDLVAVALDPDNSSSFNPLDAYYLVVKANGNAIGLRGTVEAGAMGASTAWPNNVRAAVRVYDDRWQAEVTVPLADLGARDKLGRWWGADFQRLTASAAEMSTWSAAKNPTAKPVSLGNLFFAK